VTASAKELIEMAKDPKLQRMPKAVQALIHQLAQRLELSESALEGSRKRYAEELDVLRVQLADGPEDSDTFVAMPNSIMADETREVTMRPVGQGVKVEFRRPGDMEGEGFEVHIEGDRLHVDSIGSMGIMPTYGGNFEIREI
jgi:hypothetical protein